MTLSLIAAMSRNRVIGRNNRLPWHLPADLRWFKASTMGHHLIMGRKTFELVGRPLPGRTNVVVTRDPRFEAEGVTVCRSVEEATRLAAEAGDGEPFIAGGAEIFRQTLERADRLYLTRIDAEIEGDTFFPHFDEEEWTVTFQEDHEPDERNRFRYSFLIYDRNGRSATTAE